MSEPWDPAGESTSGRGYPPVRGRRRAPAGHARLGYPRLLVGAAVSVIIGIGAAVVAFSGSPGEGKGVWVSGSSDPPGSRASGGASGAPASTAPAGDVVTLSATGDILMGSAPSALPPEGGRGFFRPVREALRADLQMGNLEQPLTDDTGYRKCPEPSPPPSGSPAPPRNCFAFRAPPSYAGLLRDAGFMVMNIANNHAYDYGPEGFRQTRAALESAGLRHTGAVGQIAVVQVKGVRVAVLGFASYHYSASLTDIPAAAALVKRAAAQADLVVVQMHVGAEGADRTHVRPGVEMFHGENRGDPIAFSHAVVDAGADLVVGHGPHVMRAMEFYRGRLIAYSLGNFAGYRTLSYHGVPGVGGVLKVGLRPDGSYVSGSLVATHMVAPGSPAMDPQRRAVPLVRSLTEEDFPDSGARIGADGAISPR